MSNHDILSVALQKYYSSLKALESFGNNNSLFDDVSSLDSFFSEFRNITFVIQKAVGTEENKAIYKELCSKHLSSDELKWFVNTRNKTTKESPFQLKKELVVDVYMPDGVYTLKDTRLVVDFDNSFGEILELIENVFLKKFELPEIFFSSRIIFSENGAEIDFYPQIRSGLMKMNDFMEDLFLHFPCECSICLALKKKIDDLYRLVQCKEIKFSNDYTLNFDSTAEVGEQTGFYLGNCPSDITPISDLRISLDNLYYKDAKDCIVKLFKKFASSHTVIFQMQRSIFPVFMIVYQDQTHRMIPFVATTKASFYRNILEVTKLSDFSEINAVFFCCEYYGYEMEKHAMFGEKPYAERIKESRKECLSFALITREGKEMLLSLDEKQIDDLDYLKAQFSSLDWLDEESACFSALNPIRAAFKKLNFVNEN